MTLRGAKRRGLLAYLVVHAGEAVSLDRLVDDLWDQRPSSGAPGTVQSYLSGLRKMLAPDDHVTLETRPGGYALNVAAECVDAARFEGLCVQVGAEQQAAQRLKSLDEALALWRGAPLGEFAGSTWADVEAARLGALHLQALQQRVEAQLALGRHHEAIPELERLVRDHRLDERFWGQMMVAYYRAGRQADALRAYQQVRSVLAEELGVEPGAALAELERQVLDHDLVLMVSPEAAPGAGGVPLPPRLGLGGVFVGREDECERLDGALEAVRLGEGRRVVLMSGEPGIGKTTLAARFARPAHDVGAVVLYGRCDEGLGIPYQPWAEALTHLVRHVDESVLAAHVKTRGGELTRLVPELIQRVSAPPVASSDPEADRYLLFGAAVDLLAQASRDGPMVLVLEDLHSADLPTLQLLRHVVGDTSLRLLVVATYRETDIGDHPLAATLADLHREPGVERITLSGLGPDALGALVKAAGDRDLDAAGVALRDALAAETDGNPFFVTEVLRDLIETRALHPGEDNFAASSGDVVLRVPASVRDVIVQRVTRLGDEARVLLSVAAVIGRDFDLDLLVEVVDFDEFTVLDALDAAAVAALVRPATSDADRYTFVHALIAHALLEPLSPARRRRAHARIARALERHCGDDPGERIGELAHHWLAGGEDPDKSIEYVSRAGDRALAQLAPDEALHWYSQALEVLERTAGPDDPRRGNLLVGLGRAQRQTGDPAHRETLLAAAHLAQRLHDTELLVRAAVANSRGTSSTIYGTDAERVEVLEAARAATEGQPTRGRSQVLATLAAELAFSDRTRMHVVADEAIELAKRLGDDPTFVTVATRLEMPLRTPDTLAQRVALGTEATAAAERIADPVLRWLAANMNYTSALEAGDAEAFRTHVQVIDRLARQNGQPHMLWVSALARSLGASVDGQLDRAEQFAAEALEIGMNNGQADAFFVYGGQLIAIRFDQGRLDELSDLVEQSAAAIPGGEGRVIRALYYSEVGRPDDAGRLVEMDAANGFSAFSFDVTWTSCMAIYAQVAANVRNQRAAARLVEQIEPWRDQVATSGTSIWNGSIAHGLGLALGTTGRFDEAEEAFAEAAAVHERMRAPLLLARTRFEWARLLRRRNGDRERARELAHAARAVAAELGAGSIERGADELVDSLGVGGGSAL